MVNSRPLVSVVVVNLNGRKYLDALLQALHTQDWEETEICLVDNGSTDGSVELVRDRYPFVNVVAVPQNMGFARGNNLGMEIANGRYIALLNNDTIVDSRWLAPLVEEARSSANVGAVSSKILFARPFLPVTLVVPGVKPSSTNRSLDSRKLGVFVASDSCFQGCTYHKPIFRSGFHLPEEIDGRRGCWTTNQATLFLPIERANEATTLVLCVTGGHLPAGRPMTVSIGEAVLETVEIDGQWRAYRLAVTREVVDRECCEIINNAGSFLTDDWNAGDRGIFEVDRGQYDTAEDIGAICGCSVLFSREALDKVGRFDRDYFAYFEDTELSCRLKRHGYRLRYQPASVVRHYHASTMGEWSPGFTFLVIRNRLLMIIKHSRLTVAVSAYVTEVFRLARALAMAVRYMKRDPLDPARQELCTRFRVQWSLLKLAPRAILKRIGLLAD